MIERARGDERDPGANSLTGRVFVVSDWCSLGLCDIACLCTEFTTPRDASPRLRSQLVVIEAQLELDLALSV